MKTFCKTGLSLLFLFVKLINGYGQIDVIADKSYQLDSLNINSFSTDVNVLFSISDNENNDHTDFKFLSSARFSYLFKNTDIEFSFRQMLERTEDGTFESKHYLFLSSGIFKFRPISRFTTKFNKIYFEPLFIFQNNSDRGLHRRFQAGILLHPWGFIHPKFKMNAGIGFVRDWSSWEVNDTNEIEEVSPELQEKIRFVNSHISLKDNMYQLHSEWRPMLLLNLNYQINDIITFNLNTSVQQSLKTPYSEEICSQYPEFKKVHPYILSQFAVGVKVYKGFELKFIQDIDYENSNLSLYKSSWTYHLLFGASWTFSNQRIHYSH